MHRFNVLVGIITLFEGRVLLTERSREEKFMPGALGIPAGKVNFGERLEEAVARELIEETGLIGVIRKLVGYSMFMSRKDDDELHNLQVNFWVDANNSGPITLDKSSQSYRWVSLEELESQGLDDFTLSAIRQAIVAMGKGGNNEAVVERRSNS
jgi:ADP-ribose pyrophosphatase YjhB (NUDIX family)